MLKPPNTRNVVTSLHCTPVVGMVRAGVVLVLGTVLPACGASLQTPETPAKPQGAQSPVDELVLARTVVTPDEALSIPEMFQRAEQDYEQGELTRSVEGFDRVAKLDPDGPFAVRALFRAAEVWEETGDHAGAAHRFEQLTRRYPGDRLAKSALVRAIRLNVFKEQWQLAGDQAKLLLTRYETSLSPRDLIVGYSARALALVVEANDSEAEYFVNRGRSLVEEYRLDSAGVIPRDLAQLFFALGEIRRIRAERIRFDDVRVFADRFEARAQLLLDAQSAYSDAMRAYDAHWTAMAGFRVGELYGKLHAEVMRVPRPPGANTERRRLLLEGAMRLRYSVLLRKGISMFEHALAMAERTQEQSEWVTRTRHMLRELEQAQLAEQKAIDALPFSRLDLQRVLDEIARRQP